MKDKSISEDEAFQLREYVAKAKAKGYSEKRIHKNLVHAGWQELVVDSILEEKLETKPIEQKNAIIRCVGLTKTFGENVVLDDINLEINQGEIFGIIGMSGSGKTTLLNAVIGFLEPDEGEIFFRHPQKMEYLSVQKKPIEVKRLFGFATQEPSFYNKLTAEENLDHFGSLYNLPTHIRKTNVNLLLDLMGLTESKKTLSENLSGGMQRRLGIACSLIHDPKILILDEPTADLDPFLRKEMWNLIKKINEQGTTVILSSHFLSEIEELCTRVGILHNRRIMQIGTPNDLRSRLSKNEEIHIKLISGNYDKLIKELQRENLDIAQICMRDKRLVIITPRAEKVLHSIIHLIERTKEEIDELEVVNKPSLYEVFEALIKK